MDWTKSYSSTWRVFRVNRDTWADAEAVQNVIEVGVTKTANGALIESGSMQITGTLDPDYYRIVLTAEQGGEIQRVDVATLLYQQHDGNYNHGVDTTDLEGYSVLYPASTKAVTVGEYAPSGVNGAEYAADLLADAINAPVEVEGSFTLNEHVVHELGTTVLDAAWSVLTAGNFVIQIDGSGVVHIRPMPTEPALIINNESVGMLMNEIGYTADISEIPNRYVVIDGVNITIAENNDPESAVSYPSRGFHVDLVDTSPALVNGETYAGYAERMLKSASILKEEKDYNREYAPDVYPYSLIKASVDGLEGNFRIESQSLACKNGIVVTEKAAKETLMYEG